MRFYKRCSITSTYKEWRLYDAGIYSKGNARWLKNIEHKLLCQTIPQPTTSPLYHVMNIIIYNRKGRYSYFYNHILQIYKHIRICTKYTTFNGMQTRNIFTLHAGNIFFFFTLHFQEQLHMYSGMYIGALYVCISLSIYLWALKSYVNM